MKWLRCFMTDDDRQASITADLLIDGDENCVSALRYFGQFEGDGATYPITFINDDDAVDLGSEYDKGRYEKMKVHGRRIVKGAIFRYTDPTGEYEFVMQTCVDESARQAP